MALEYYDLEKTAELLKLTAGEVNRLRERGELRAFRDGSNWKFKRDDVEKYLTESIKNRSKNAAAAAAADEDFLSLDGSDDEELPTLLADSASFDSLAPHDFMGDEEGGLVIADDDIGMGEEELGLGPVEDEGDIFALADDDLSISSSEDSGLSLGSESDIQLAGDSGIDLAGDSGVMLEDDDLILGGSGSGSDINIAGDSGLSLLDAGDSGFALDTSPGGSDSILELADDDDILSLVEEADSDTATILTSDSDFQLTPDASLDNDDSESSSQVIALDDDPMFVSDLEDSAVSMFSEDDPFASATMVPDGLPPLPGGTAGPQQAATFTAPDAGSPFGSASPFDSPDMQASMQPVTPIVAKPSSSGANYSGLTMTFLVCAMLFLTLATISGLDMVRWIWSWGEPFLLTGMLMDAIAGILPL